MSCVWYLFILAFLQVVDITALTKWPRGTYGLLRPKTGCPTEWKENSGWKEKEWIYQRTLNDKHCNNKSNILNVEGKVDERSIFRNFCLKTSDTPGSKTWQEGKYCLYSRDYSTPGMQSGTVEMNGNGQRISRFAAFTFAFSSYYNRFIYLYFSCQTSGNKTIPIELPIDKPFYLLPYGSSECQQVKWMVATSEWIKYHTRDYQYYNETYHTPDLRALHDKYHIRDKGHHYKYAFAPYYEIGDSENTGIKMYYCYYETCKYTLKNKTGGVFQSPGFPGKYPDGQLCSWRITVPANHTIHVHFTNFSLDGNTGDYLQLYKQIHGAFKVKQAFFGDQRPFNVTATSDVMFVFQSDKENHSTGFRAEFSIFPSAKNIRIRLNTTQSLKEISSPKKPPTTKQSTVIYTEKNDKSIIQTSQGIRTTTKYNLSNNHSVHSLKGSRACDVNWNIVVMVIPLVCCILIILIAVDIVCRCRYIKAKKTTSDPRSSGDRLAMNMTYERGDIILNEAADITVDATVDANDDKPLSRDERRDSKDLDHTQINEVPCENLDNEDQIPVEPVSDNVPEVFYHVLERPEEVFYHVLEGPADM